MSFNLSSTPFTSTSAWNQQVPTGATYTKLNWPTATGWNYGVTWSNGSPPVYVASSSDPVVQVSVPASWGWPGGTVSLHVPAGATGGAAGGVSNPDLPILIVDGDTVYNFWQFNRTGNTTATASAYGEANVVTGTGWGSSGLGAGITAAGSSELGGLLVKAQTDTGTIDHALQLAVDTSTLKPGYMAPAIGGDGVNSNGFVQEGQLLAIAPGTPMPSGLSPLGQEVFRALQQYGAYVTDNGNQETAIRAQANAYDSTTMNALRVDLNSMLPLLQAVSGGTPTSSGSTSTSGGTASSGTTSSGTTSGGTTVTSPTGGTSSGSTSASSGSTSGSSTPATPVAPTLTVADHSLSVSPGGQIPLGLSVSVPHAGDNVTVNISGLPGYETITDKLDGKTFSGSSVTLTAAEVNSGLTLSSSYKGHGRPSATLTVTATDATGTPMTSAAQTITVKDPPAVATSSGSSTTTGGSTSSGDSHHRLSDHHNAVATTSSGTTTSGNSLSHSQASHSNIAQWIHDYPGFAHVATTLSEAGASRSGVVSTPTTTTTGHAAGAGAKAYALLNQMMAGDFGHESHFAQTGVATALSALSQHQPSVLTRALH